MRCSRITAQDVVQCVSRRLLWCPCGVAFCGRGAALVAAQETQRLPALRGNNQRAAAPATLFRPPGRPCRKESQTVSLIPFQIPSPFKHLQGMHCVRGSRRQWVVSPRTRVSGARDYCKATGPRVYKSPWSPRPLQGNRPPCLQKQC